MKQYPVTFVSLGPGEPELITLKGLRALQQADIILCPATKTGNGNISSRAADILTQLEISENKIKLFPLPMSKDRSQAMKVYDEMYETAVSCHSHSSSVVIVAEGDAGFYSSIHYVYERLHTAGIPVNSVPGIPAFIACGAVAGLHIVQQEERLMIIPGTITTKELADLLADGITVVIMKLSQCVSAIHECMIAHPSYTYHYFENVGTDKEYYSYDVSGLKEKKYPYFSLMIIQKPVATP